MTGAGKYDDLCTYCRTQANAMGAIVVVIRGNKGSGMSVQLEQGHMMQGVPDILREIARMIEESERENFEQD